MRASHPSIASQIHRASVQAFREHHGRALTWLYATRNLWLTLFLVSPILIFAIAWVPFAAIGLFLVCAMGAVETHVKRKRSNGTTGL